MPKHSETRVLPHQPGQMFDLVADVARYPEFLPWCAAARVKSRENTEFADVMIAELVISFRVFREKYTSRVVMTGRERIETDYIDGPFKHLRSDWAFHEMDGGCEVDFFVDFEFRNPILQGAAGLFFHTAMQRIVGAFEARAAELYG